MTTPSKIYDVAIVGTVGLPASYGGFETLAEQLVRNLSHRYQMLVFCSGKRYPSKQNRPDKYDGANLDYLELDANGWQSVPYDIVSLLRGARRSRSLLVLGVSGGLMLPIIRLFWPKVHIATNVDGIEWKRQKWGWIARTFLHVSEWSAVRFSHDVVADNQGICDHINENYGRAAHLIAYGGDNTASVVPDQTMQPVDTNFEPHSYYFAVCRIEPENNLTSILEAFAQTPNARLVVVGNWDSSIFARNLREKFSNNSNIEMRDPIYDQVRLGHLRTNAKAYVHGHSAGGTNPSLVEAMYANMAILAFDVVYNRYTTENLAIYWLDTEALTKYLCDMTDENLRKNAQKMGEVARRHYTWSAISKKYGAIIPLHA